AGSGSGFLFAKISARGYCLHAFLNAARTYIFDRVAHMIRPSKFSLIGVASASLFGLSAYADEVKSVAVEQGKATIIANFGSPRPDCSTIPAPQPLPALSQKPLHGTVGVQIGMTNVPASGNCPARKIPSLALFYIAQPDFTGVDPFQIEIDDGKGKETRVLY